MCITVPLGRTPACVFRAAEIARPDLVFKPGCDAAFAEPDDKSERQVITAERVLPIGVARSNGNGDGDANIT